MNSTQVDLSKPESPWRRALRIVWRTMLAIPSILLLVAIVVTVSVQVVQDRRVWLAPIFYVPLWPIGGAAVAWDLVRLGRALPLRWLMLCLGLAVGVLGVGGQMGPARAAESVPGGRQVSVLHWNVRWGGLKGGQSLQKIVAELRARDADVMLISELPPEEWFLHEWRKTGHEVHHAIAGYGPGQADYWYRVGVFSRWPVVLRDTWRLPDGKAALFEVEVPADRSMRLLAVDIESSPRVHRAPSLRRIGEIAEQLSREGRAADVIAGDFNAPSRAYGFDAISVAGEGYRRAALWSGQWRATWPRQLPIYDIDHVLVRRGAAIRGCGLFSNEASDHRGQVANISLPP
jgi:endonuclease/exonuclease/phosphatase family metal-dependent hydrolase